MATIVRTTKRGNVPTFQQSYDKGYRSIWATEVDADFDTLYSAWNSGLDGSLALADNSVTTAKLADGAVTVNKLAANSVGAGAIIDGSVGTAEIQNLAVTQAKIAGGAVGTAQLTADAVDASKILDGSVGTAELAALSVTTAKIADGAITTIKIGDAQVTDAKIVSLAWAKITGAPTGLAPTGAAGGSLAGTYPNPTIKAGAVGGTEILDGSVSLVELAPNVTSKLVPSYGTPEANKQLLVDGAGTGLVWGTVSTTLPPSGPASGDLTGTYPAPTIALAKVTRPKLDADLNNSIPPAFTAGNANMILTVNPSATGMLWTTTPPASITEGQISTPFLADAPAGVSTQKINDLAVTTAKLADSAITDAKIADVAWAKITGAPTTLPPSGTAGGDLSGSYPNPVAFKASGVFDVYGATTTVRGDTASGASTWAQLSRAGGADQLILMLNNPWIPQDASKGSWHMLMTANGSAFLNYRAAGAAAGATSTMFTFSNGGNFTAQGSLAVISPLTSNAITAGPSGALAKSRIIAPSAGTYGIWSVNASDGGTQDDNTKPAWRFRMDLGADQITIQRAPAAGAHSVLLTFRSDGTVRAITDPVNALDLATKQYTDTKLAGTAAAGGDLTGNYPNPTLKPGVINDADVTDVSWGKITGVPAGATAWTDTGTALTPATATRPVIVPGPTAGGIDSASILFGSRTAKGRLISLPSLDWVGFSKNRKYDGTSWTQDDASIPSWTLQFDQVDNFVITRQAASGGSSANPLVLNNSGQMTIIGGVSGSTLPSITYGPRTIKHRFIAGSGEATQWNINNNGANVRDDTSKVSWITSMYSDIDQWRIDHIDAAGTSRLDLWVRGSDGKVWFNAQDGIINRPQTVGGCPVGNWGWAAVSTGFTTTAYNTWVDVATLTAFTTRANAMVILLGYHGLVYNALGTQQNAGSLQWTRNGTVVHVDQGWKFAAAGSYSIPPCVEFDFPGAAGTYTYKLQVYNSGASAGSITQSGFNSRLLAGEIS